MSTTYLLRTKFKKGTHDYYDSGMYSKFSRQTESVKPGYYKVYLDRYDVDVELTATKHVGFHKYTYPTGVKNEMIINIADHFNWDKPKKFTHTT